MTLPCFLPTRTLGRCLNHEENLLRANLGSKRTLEIPAVFSTTLRMSEPGLAPSKGKISAAVAGRACTALVLASSLVSFS